MKVETPQILWNSEGDKGINAALHSISMLESGLSEDEENNNNNNGTRKYGTVLVSAGNTPVVNLWKLSFSSSSSSSSPGMFQKQASGTKIDYLCSLTRQELSVNTVAFSPDGLHLATGGETGSVVVWSVPPNFRGNGNGRHYWSTLTREQDLKVKIFSSGGPQGQGICDISWSADSKRFIAGTIDHSVFVCEDTNYDANHHQPMKNNGEAAAAAESNWQIVYRNSSDHTQYVQGVAYDPLGVYLATMGSDRTVRVFPRKTPPKSKKKVLRPANNSSSSTDCFPPPEHQRMVGQLLTDSKLDITKSKLIKFRRTPTIDQDDNNNNNNNAPKPPRSHLYVDESTLESFFRRLSWTSDGAYLVTPAALWHSADEAAAAEGEKTSPSFATYLFARHKFDEPCKVLSGLEKPSLVVRPSPVLYKLPGSDGTTADSSSQPLDTDCKENESPLTRNKRGLPYRSVFAVLTLDSILVYDTHHTRPLSIIRGLHYASLSDCQWTNDGMNLVVSSTDGYITFVSFDRGELGEVYGPATVTTATTTTTSCTNATPRSVSPPLPLATSNNHANNKVTNNSNLPSSAPRMEKTAAAAAAPMIPPCEPGQSATLEARPTKRPKKTRITPTLISGPAAGTAAIKTTTTIHAKRPAEDLLEKETNTVGEAVTKLSLNHTEENPKKKKKRIAPLLISPPGN